MTDGGDEAVGQKSDGLQVELFHPDSDREPGDTNIERYGFDVHPVVFPVAVALIVLFVTVTLLYRSIASVLGWTMPYPEEDAIDKGWEILGPAPGEGEVLVYQNAEAAYTIVFDFINANFGWFYILVVNVFIIALLYFAFSKYGEIRLGGVNAEPEFSTFSWMAMLFSAGMGIGLMFFSVAEPIFHFGDGTNIFPGVEPNSAAAADSALGVTFFHWGFHPWAVYGLVALGLGFFSFNRGLPLTFRSVFYPLLGDRIYDWPGHVIDLITVFATIFGLATSLGLGAQQINAGLARTSESVAGTALISSGSTGWQVLIIAVITLIAIVSVAAGLHRGVKRLSTINVYLMGLFLGFIIFVGPTLYILESVVGGIGTYFQNFMQMAFFTGNFVGGETAGGYEGWRDLWTVFYWGWWIAWSPFVGLFIARISRGRTIRQMVAGVLLLPTAFSLVWLGSFGGAALYAQQNLGAGIYDAAYINEATATFAMLEVFPLTVLASLLAVLLVTTFFVTSSDSGSLVVDHLTSGGKHDVPRAQRVFWAGTEGVVAGVLLIGGGLIALQTAAITTGLPFAAILLLMVYTLYQGLDNEYEILQSEEFREHVSDVDRSSADGVSGVGEPGVDD